MTGKIDNFRSILHEKHCLKRITSCLCYMLKVGGKKVWFEAVILERNFQSSCIRLILLVGNPHKLSGTSSVSGGNQTRSMFQWTDDMLTRWIQ